MQSERLVIGSNKVLTSGSKTARHTSASEAFAAGALNSAAARSKCAAAAVSSTAERGPAFHALHFPISTHARMQCAFAKVGAAFTTLADNALSPSSLHHSGLATSVHSCVFSRSKACAVASAQLPEPTGQRFLASRNRYITAERLHEHDPWLRLTWSTQTHARLQDTARHGRTHAQRDHESVQTR